MKPGADSLDHVLARPQRLPARCCVITGLLAGSTATTCTAGLRALSTSPTPVIVPPVPTPATTMSTARAVSRQISSAWSAAVDLRIGRILELLRHEVVAVLGDQLLGHPHRARHALGRRREDQLGAEGLQHPPPLQAHAFGHGHHQLVAACGADIGQADARIAAGRLDDHVSAWICPWRSAASIIARPMRSLTLHSGLRFSILARIVAGQSGGMRRRRTSGVLPMQSVMVS